MTPLSSPKRVKEIITDNIYKLKLGSDFAFGNWDLIRPSLASSLVGGSSSSKPSLIVNIDLVSTDRGSWVAHIL